MLSASSSVSEASRYKLWLVVEDAALKATETYSFAVRKDESGGANAGVDLLTAEEWRGLAAPGMGAHLLNLGVRAMMTRMDTGEPVHYWLLPRSSIYKTGFMMANSVGVIDKSYRGILKAPVLQVAAAATGFACGERHFQIVAPDMGWIEEVERVEALPATTRGEGGFGSTGVR